MRSILPVVLIPLVPLTACRSASHTEHLEAQGAFGPYSAAVMTEELVFVSGKIGSDTSSFEAEARSAIEAVRAELSRVGLGLEDVVSATVYLTDMNRYAEINKIYSEMFSSPYPARACIAVAALPRNAQVEVQVIAARRE